MRSCWRRTSWGSNTQYLGSNADLLDLPSCGPNPTCTWDTPLLTHLCSASGEQQAGDRVKPFIQQLRFAAAPRLAQSPLHPYPTPTPPHIGAQLLEEDKLEMMRLEPFIRELHARARSGQDPRGAEAAAAHAAAQVGSSTVILSIGFSRHVHPLQPR